MLLRLPCLAAARVLVNFAAYWSLPCHLRWRFVLLLCIVVLAVLTKSTASFLDTGEKPFLSSFQRIHHETAKVLRETAVGESEEYKWNYGSNECEDEYVDEIS